MSIVESTPSFFRSLWIYQRERFPLLANGLLIACFTVSAVLYSGYVRGGSDLPQSTELLAGYVTVLLVFLLMRFLDEFKDAEDDAKYRPYRPVPRGLISLRSIGWLAACVVAVQLQLQWLWLPGQFVLLGFVYAYLLLMTFEFGAPHWLKRHPMVYALSHMVIMPIIGLYATGIDWAPSGRLPAGLLGLFTLLFACGLVIEIGRKIRAPVSEERGVDSYSALYGPARAAAFWLASVFATLVLTLWLLRDANLAVFLSTLLIAGFACCAALFVRYLLRCGTRDAQNIEWMSGLWSLLVFSSVAVGAYTHPLLEVLS